MPALASWEGLVVALGRLDEVHRRLEGLGLALDRFAALDAGAGTVTPGLIDPHTHLLFAGSREAEWEMRRQGQGYLEILAGGGGILATVARTRAATADELHRHGRRWLDEMLRRGVTTVEAKSGYGLDRKTELRLLEVAGRLGREGPVEVVPTFLGAHAVPAEYRGRPDAAGAYVETVLEDQLPAIAGQGVARFCDVFCEPGVFSVTQARRVLQAGSTLGLKPRLHADELAASGGAELAAELGAASADHLAAVSEEGIATLADAADRGRPVIATLLPATTFNLVTEHYAPARQLIEKGVPVALGTDFNPGTSPTPNLPLVMAIGCRQLRMTPAEALAAVTINAAAALGLTATHGSLEPGKQADLVVWNVPTYQQLPYWLGADLVRAVVKRGELVFSRA
jgi:imidazolonepropionase